MNEKANCRCGEIANILDRLFASIAASIDQGQQVDMNNIGPMSECLAGLMGVWMELRPGSSDVGTVRAALVQKRSVG